MVEIPEFLDEPVLPELLLAELPELLEVLPEFLVVFALPEFLELLPEL